LHLLLAAAACCWLLPLLTPEWQQLGPMPDVGHLQAEAMRVMALCSDIAVDELLQL